MKSMDRRDFLKLMGIAGLTTLVPWPRAKARAQTLDPYGGSVFITFAASGGWDPTSFCDPKMNVPGAPEINRWSRTATTQTIDGSSITYAPFANNAEFFARFHPDMLVINGIDTETNSHDVGVRNNWSGRVPPGYPSFSALAASVFGDGLPLPYLTNAGYRETAGLATYTELTSARDLQDLVDPNRVPGRDRFYHDADELAVIERYQRERTEGQMDDPRLLPRQRHALTNLALARASRDQLQSLVLSLPAELVDPVDKDGFRNPLLQQAQLALVCCNAGLTVACDLEVGGFDTHQNHDAAHRGPLMQLENGITYLWDTAEALGLADRLVVVVASDFGRTPSYNGDNGKDHWPISSAILMKRGAPWANRAVGATDECHHALSIDPQSLAASSDAAAVRLRPADVHVALRRLAGIETHANALRYPLGANSVDLFDGTV
jgi:hypothetical protein